MGKFSRGLIALGVVEEDTVAGQFGRIATGHQIEQRPAVRQSVQGRRLAGGYRRRHHARPEGDKKFQPLRHRDHRGRNQPGIFTRASGRDQHAGEAQSIRRLGDLLQIAVIDRTGTLFSAQITTITMGR